MALKAQNSYALARQAMEKIAALESDMLSAREEMAGLRADNEALVRHVGRLQRGMGVRRGPGRPRKVPIVEAAPGGALANRSGD